MGQTDTAENAQHFSRRDRWATFDCYGTLIDWDGGTRAAFGREPHLLRDQRVADREDDHVGRLG